MHPLLATKQLSVYAHNTKKGRRRSQLQFRNNLGLAVLLKFLDSEEGTCWTQELNLACLQIMWRPSKNNRPDVTVKIQLSFFCGGYYLCYDHWGCDILCFEFLHNVQELVVDLWLFAKMLLDLGVPEVVCVFNQILLLHFCCNTLAHFFHASTCSRYFNASSTMRSCFIAGFGLCMWQSYQNLTNTWLISFYRRYIVARQQPCIPIIDEYCNWLLIVSWSWLCVVFQIGSKCNLT